MGNADSSKRIVRADVKFHADSILADNDRENVHPTIRTTRTARKYIRVFPAFSNG